jgi:hypothetical protein
LRSAATWTLRAASSNDRARPSPRHQPFFRDRLAGALGQRSQNIKRAAPEAQEFPVLGQHALRGDQPERPEGEDFFIHRAIVSRALRLFLRL